MLNQDLHIHTTFSSGDGAVVPYQTVELVKRVHHAKIVGISDHFEYLFGPQWDKYERAVRDNGLLVGTEVNGYQWARDAAEVNADFYHYHCRGEEPNDYIGIDTLLSTGKPVIIAHPYATQTDLNKVPEEAYIEVNNRYIYRFDWKKELGPFVESRKFTFGSDAHQPHWLNQNIVKMVADELGIKETILF